MQQVESAWRQHDLLKKLDSGDLLSSAPAESFSSAYAGTHTTVTINGSSRGAADNSPPRWKSNKRARSPTDGATANDDSAGTALDSSDGSSSDGSSSGASRSPTPERARSAAARAPSRHEGDGGRDEVLSERDMWALRKVSTCTTCTPVGCL